ncbi:MAG TPA: hypothetical protein VGR57_12925 [Ktedonobacterales bacterium]|nr:hypothetical protein [Ktedonobacterales bacterium]
MATSEIKIHLNGEDIVNALEAAVLAEMRDKFTNVFIRLAELEARAFALEQLPGVAEALAAKEATLPTMEEIGGSIPDFTGGVDSVTYVRRMRDGE